MGISSISPFRGSRMRTATDKVWGGPLGLRLVSILENTIAAENPASNQIHLFETCTDGMFPRRSIYLSIFR